MRGTTSLYGGAGGDSLSGGAGNDILYGGAGEDSLRGDEGDDILYGGAGDDYLRGGEGDDILYGGAGADTYYIGISSGFDYNTIISDEDKGGMVSFYSGWDALAIENFRRVDDDNDQVGTNDDLEITLIDHYGYYNTGYKWVGATVVIEDYYAAESTFLITERRYRTEPLSDDLVNSIAALSARRGEGFTVSIRVAGTTPTLATLDSEVFTGDDQENTVSYANAGSLVFVDLTMSISNIGGFARGDTYASIENLIGSDHDDVLRGNDRANSLLGGAGNDTLQGGLGNDLLDGGEGVDTVSFEGEMIGITLRLGEGSEDGFSMREGSSEQGIIRNVERVLGSLADDVIVGNAAYNRLEGRAGNDEIRGGAGNDSLHGNEGNDSLHGNEGNDKLYGGAGDDELYGGEGDDTLDGGDGNYDDELYGGAGDDTLDGTGNLYGGAGDDNLKGTGNLYGGAGDDSLRSYGGDDILVGGAGDDILVGGRGADTIDGGEGTDTASYSEPNHAYYYYFAEGVRVSLLLQGQEQQLFDGTPDFFANNKDAVGDILTNIENLEGSIHNDWLTGDGNDNTLIGGRGDDRLNGGAGDDTLRGDRDDDTLYGDTGDDTLEGSYGDDTLHGGAGDDTLDGGWGSDRLEGGAGTDTYGFSTSHGTDTIVDEAGDTMTLRFVDDRYRGSYEAADFLQASNNFNRVGNNLVITIDTNPNDRYTDTITILDAYDSDPNTGTGNAAFTINIEYGSEGSDTFTEVTNEFWHTLA